MSKGLFNPEMLTLARMSRSVTQSQLAEQAETTQGRVSKIEHGLLEPTNDLIQRFARILHYPPAFFCQPGYVHTLPTWFHRKRKHLSKTALERVHAEIAIRIRNITKLLQSVDLRSPAPMPQIDVDEYEGSVEDIARHVRETWGLPSGPIPNLIEVVERAGAVVVPCEFGVGEVDAVAMRLQGLPPLMFVNSSAPTDRLRFSVAHELAHIIMHALPSDEMEKEADRFAAEFLMPEYDIKPQLYGLDLPVLAVLKKVWRVSMAALLKRAQDLRVITAKRAQTLWKRMSALGFRRREPAELDLDPEMPRLLADMLAFHLGRLGLSSDDLMKMFLLYEADFGRLYALGPRRGGLRLVG